VDFLTTASPAKIPILLGALALSLSLSLCLVLLLASPLKKVFLALDFVGREVLFLHEI
jgi:hypothetical protein